MTFYLDRLSASNEAVATAARSGNAGALDGAPTMPPGGPAAAQSAPPAPLFPPASGEGVQRHSADDAEGLGPSDFYELVLRDGAGLDRYVVDPELQEAGVRQLLGVGVAGTLLYGAMVGLVAQMSAPIASMGLGRFPVITLPLALTGAFLGALAICLPSFYFYTQLSGVDASLRIVTGQALRAQARTSVLLLGVLPIYVAIALASVVGAIEGGAELVSGGIALPFVVGLWGLRSLWSSFRRLSASLPVAHQRRPWFLPRMVLAWGMVYSVVAPLALYRLIEALAIVF
jgi:hypothetical protein